MCSISCLCLGVSGMEETFVACLRITTSSIFVFYDTATANINTLSLHDALPISLRARAPSPPPGRGRWRCAARPRGRSEKHTSELQSRLHLVCRLLLEKKKTNHFNHFYLYSPVTDYNCSAIYAVIARVCSVVRVG